jgi:integrase
MASLRKRGKVWYYRYVDADGVKRESKGCTDKRATEELARHKEAEIAKIKAGLLDSRELAFCRHAARPVADHLADYHAYLLAKGSTRKYAGMVAYRARRVLDRAKVNRLADLTPSRVQDALKAILGEAPPEREGRGARPMGKPSKGTANHYRDAVRGFSRWLLMDGRTPTDTLAAVTGFNAKEDRRHDRRTLGVGELRMLIETAHTGPTWNRMTGPVRALLYRLAVGTGLRYSEIMSVRSESFDWTATTPTVTAAAACTKNGEPATLPLPADLAEDLARYVATIAPGRPVFPLTKNKGAEMLRRDLERASIPYRDAAGLVYDFHSLRCQCATLADAAGVSPRVVQKLMRHSTLEMTGKYTRPRAVDIERAAQSLPSLRPASDRPESSTLVAAGSGGRISDLLAHHLPTEGDGSRRIPSHADAITGSDEQPPMLRFPGENEAPDGSRRTETHRVVGAKERGGIAVGRDTNPLLVL